MKRSNADRQQRRGWAQRRPTVLAALWQAAALVVNASVLPGPGAALAALLRDLAVFLGDIHGQHDQQLLFSPEAQLNIVDQAADNAGLVARTLPAAAPPRPRCCVMPSQTNGVAVRCG